VRIFHCLAFSSFSIIVRPTLPWRPGRRFFQGIAEIGAIGFYAVIKVDFDLPGGQQVESVATTSSYSRYDQLTSLQMFQLAFGSIRRVIQPGPRLIGWIALNRGLSRVGYRFFLYPSA
jgi:hypothetical protein